MASFQFSAYKIATTVYILTISLGIIYPLCFGCSGKYISQCVSCKLTIMFSYWSAVPTASVFVNHHETWCDMQGYGMVFASICEHASSAFIFPSASSDKFSHASSEHFVNFPPSGISLYWNVVLCQVILLTLSKQDNRHKARQHDKSLPRFNHSQ